MNRCPCYLSTQWYPSWYPANASLTQCAWQMCNESKKTKKNTESEMVIIDFRIKVNIWEMWMKECCCSKDNKDNRGVMLSAVSMWQLTAAAASYNNAPHATHRKLMSFRCWISDWEGFVYVRVCVYVCDCQCNRRQIFVYAPFVAKTMRFRMHDFSVWRVILDHAVVVVAHIVFVVTKLSLPRSFHFRISTFDDFNDMLCIWVKLFWARTSYTVSDAQWRSGGALKALLTVDKFWEKSNEIENIQIDRNVSDVMTLHLNACQWAKVPPELGNGVVKVPLDCGEI